MKRNPSKARFSLHPLARRRPCAVRRGRQGAGTVRSRVTVANDLGLLAEEFDPGMARQTGNFPQALTISADQYRQNLSHAKKPSRSRRCSGRPSDRKSGFACSAELASPKWIVSCRLEVTG